MTPLQTVIFIFIQLPAYVLMDGAQKLFRFLKEEEGRMDMFLYILTGVLALLVIYLVATGHPIR